MKPDWPRRGVGQVCVVVHCCHGNIEKAFLTDSVVEKNIHADSPNKSALHFEYGMIPAVIPQAVKKTFITHYPLKKGQHVSGAIAG
ncbi:hypothetical protein CEXT_120251 [Caerostris extrusa]|uniref:Uncharacterized protein n=1 Tax=Caerostris extrusa TaxID=172846 RepID=A0AAV4XKT8_CAEEX|nr:hypothetical protein CEXT_120251 [Caerostris extrusa]